MSWARCGRREGSWLAAALMLFPAGLAAEGQGSSTALLSVSATVVRSCSVHVSPIPMLPAGSTATAAPTSSDAAVLVRCGSDAVTYPGALSSQTATRSVLPAVTVSSASKVTIEF